MKILVVSGFLGAGKTTFIKELSKKTNRLFCILENEFGAVNVDEAILKEEKDDMKIYELTSGCICCSTRGEFATTCLTIANTINPDYLIVEPTGVGSLTNIKNNLNKIAYEAIEILKPICIVDGLAVLNGTCQFNDIFIDQIQQSGSVFISKMENRNEDEKEVVHQKLAELNSVSPIYKDDYKTFSSEFFFDLLNQLSTRMTSTQEKKMVKMESVSFVDAKIPNVVFLINLLDEIARGVYGDIKRSKGIVECQGHCYQFDYVDSLYSIREFENKDNKIVFIGPDVNTKALEKRLQATALVDDD